MADGRTINRLVSQLASGQKLRKTIKLLSDYYRNDAHIRETAKVMSPRIVSTPGALGQLESLLDSDDDVTRRSALRIAGNMFHGDEGFTKLISQPEWSGFIYAFIRQADSTTDSQTRELALACLANVGLEPSSASKIAAEAGAVDLLVRLTKQLPATPDKENVRISAAQALSNFMNHSTSKTRQAIASGVMQPLSRLAISPSVKAQYVAAKSLMIIARAENPAKLPQLDTKLSIAALARMVVRGGSFELRSTVSTQTMAVQVLVTLGSPREDASSSSNSTAAREAMRDIYMDTAKALAQAKAAPTLLRIRDRIAALTLLDLVLRYVPEAYATIADHDSIHIIRVLLLHPVHAVRYLCLNILNDMQQAAPELYNTINAGIDVAKELESYEAHIAKEQAADQAAVRDVCAKCGVEVDNVLRCSACHKVLYCSKGCQRAHWKEHKPRCVQNDGDFLLY